MKINSMALSLTVPDVPASSAFLKEHFGFAEQWATDGFAYLVNESHSMPIIFLQTGNEVLPQAIRQQKAAGLIVALVVDDIEAEFKRLEGDGVVISSPLQVDPWGEKLFQVTDPNGVVYQLVQWIPPSDAAYEGNNPGQWEG